VSDRGPAAAGGSQSWVDLPPQIEGPFEVYINGVLQSPGVDYETRQGGIVFERTLTPEVGMSRIQLLLATLGIAGTYKKQDSIDIIYQSNGRRVVATGLKPRGPSRSPNQPA
jgi:hypothetical protein